MQSPPIRHNRIPGIIGAAILVLGSIAAAIILGGGTRISDGFEPFEKSANERVSQAFEDLNGRAPISDDLKTALASLSQSVQGEQKPPVQAEGQ
ncbi:hypothetical protein NLM33_39785 [Bradyrhizobium sp. CCGUVB1N3]|uniref:hypothetical protein n=1 Tax=Bradyrhizobium sp. CCGUVB1N3 TaxID=2949629 RepID=UPI0020B3C738|nr:hypothetical protein [Bradyrhizobium sp. CCGUVB1N3]MCP3476363.1 hypothetical protein [Bradyrhizobium sp. CCGUVB1N3]